MTQVSKYQLEFEVDGTGATRGLDQIGQGVQKLAQVVDQAGQTAGKGLDKITDGAKRAADGTDRELSRLRSSIQRATLDLQTAGKSASQKFEIKADFKGIDRAQIQDQISALKQLEDEQQRFQQAQQASAQANAFIQGVQAQIASVREQIIALEGGSAALLRYRAAQAGAAGDAEPLIAQLEAEKAALAAKAAADAQATASAKAQADAAKQQAAAQESVAAAILRAKQDILTSGKSASEQIQIKADLQGIDTSKLQPAIAELKQLEDEQRKVQQLQQQSASAAAFTDGLRAQIAALREQKIALEGGSAALLRYKAAQAGAKDVEPLIAELQAAEKEVKGIGGSAVISTAQMQGLVHAGRSIFDMWLAGGSVVRAVGLEAGRLTGTFGGVGNAVAAVTSLITPMRAALLAGAAAAGALALAMVHAESTARSLNTVQAQLSGTGRAGLFSNADLKGFIQQLSLAPGVTRDTATAIVSELSKVHDIGGAMFKDLSRIAVDYAKATGQDIPAATKQLAQAFSDPAQGAKELDKALGALTSSQQLQIEKLTRMGDIAGAQRVLFDALQHSVKGLADNAMTPLQKSMNDLGNAWERAEQAFDKSDGLRTMVALLAKAVESVAFLVENLPKIGGIGTIAIGSIPGVGFAAAPAHAIASLAGDDLVTRAKRFFGGESQSADATATGNLARQDRASGAQAAATAAIDGKKASDDQIKRALDVAASHRSEAGQIKDLTEQRTGLNKALAESNRLYGANSEQSQRLRDGIAGINKQINELGKGQQVIDAQLQAKIKAAQDALTKERDTIAFNEKYLQGVYQAGGISLDDFYAQKVKAIERGTAAEIAGLEEERKAVEDHLAKTRDPGKKEQDRTRLKEIGLQEQNVELKGERDIVLSNQEREQSFIQLNEELLNYRSNLRQLAGDEAGAARLRNQIADQQDKIFQTKSKGRITDDEVASAKALRDQQVALTDAKQKTSLINQQLQIEEDRIALAQSTGAIGEIESLTREGAARAQVVGKLEEQLRVMEKLSQERPEDLQLKVDVENFRLQIDKLKAALDPLKDKFDSIFKDAGSNLFSDLMNGTKPKDALRNFANTLSKQFNDITAKELSNQLFGKNGSLGGAGSFFADIFGGKDRERTKAAEAAKDTAQEAFRKSEISAQDAAEKAVASSASGASTASAATSQATAATSSAQALNALTTAAQAAAGALNGIGQPGAAAAPAGVTPTTGDFARLDRSTSVDSGGVTAGDFARLDRGQTPSGEQGVLDMFRDASKSSDTLGASNDKAAQAALQLASAATKGGGALSSLPGIIQQIIAAAQASSAASGGGGLLGLLGLGGSSSAFAPGGVASSGFGSGVAFGEQDLGLFLHSGGIVGQTNDNRPVPSGVFESAQKYHAGGIVGRKPHVVLQAHEVPAILMGGPKGVREEVLHPSDPRHSDRLTPAVIQIIREHAAKQPGFSDGGYTGDVAPDQVAGVVHGGEYVFSAPAVRAIGRDVLETIHDRAAVGDRAAIDSVVQSDTDMRSSILNLATVAHTNLFTSNPHANSRDTLREATSLTERSSVERVREAVAKGERMPGFDIGGYTGNADPKQAAGVVHGQEYVFSAPAVRAIGVDRLERLHTQAKTGRMTSDEIPGYADGGYVTALGSVRMQALVPSTQQSEPADRGDEQSSGQGSRTIHVHNNFTVAMPPGASRQTATQFGAQIAQHSAHSLRNLGRRG
jgi:hypothetical protein